MPAAQVGMAGGFMVNQLGPQGHTVDHVFLVAAQGDLVQVVYNAMFIQMSWPLLEGLCNGVPLAGLICTSESGVQICRMEVWSICG
jgi:hypothetical protein